MKLSFAAVVLALTVGALAQIDLQDPVKMDKRGNIIPAANKPRSQWEDYLQRRQFGDEGIPTHTDANGNVIFSKREAKTNPEPIVYMPRDGTNLEDPVKMDRFGRIIKA